MAINDTPATPIDLTIQPEQLIINLINNDNGLSLNINQVVFDNPELITNPVYNSSVKVSASTNSRFSGDTSVKYNRIDIGEIPGIKSTIFFTGNETKISELLPLINFRYNLNLTPADYVDANFPIISDVLLNNVDLVAANTSLVFINKLTLRINQGGRVLINTILINVVLNGFTYTKPILHSLINT